MKEEHNNEIRIKALKEFEGCENLYEVVDFLNKSLKDKNLVFVLKKIKEKKTITIYET